MVTIPFITYSLAKILNENEIMNGSQPQLQGIIAAHRRIKYIFEDRKRWEDKKLIIVKKSVPLRPMLWSS